MLIRMYGKDAGLFFDGKQDGFLNDGDDDVIFTKTVSAYVCALQRGGRVGCDQSFWL